LADPALTCIQRAEMLGALAPMMTPLTFLPLPTRSVFSAMTRLDLTPIDSPLREKGRSAPVAKAGHWQIDFGLPYSSRGSPLADVRRFQFALYGMHELCLGAFTSVSEHGRRRLREALRSK
jgi:hypothetical protein